MADDDAKRISRRKGGLLKSILDEQEQNDIQSSSVQQQSTGGIFLPGISDNAELQASNRISRPNQYLEAIEEGKIQTNVVLPGVNDKYSTTIKSPEEGIIPYEKRLDEQYKGQTIPLIKKGFKQGWSSLKKGVNNFLSNYIENAYTQNVALDASMKGLEGEEMEKVENDIKDFSKKSKAQRANFMETEDRKIEDWSSKNLNQYAREDFSKKNLRQMIKDKDWRGLKYGITEMGAQSLSMMLPGLSVGLLTRNPGLTVEVAFQTIFPQAYEEVYEKALENGWSEQGAHTGGIMVGTLNTLLEILGFDGMFGGLFKSSGGYKPLSKIFFDTLGELGEGALTEGGTEFTQEFLGNVYARLNNKDKDVMEGVLESGLWGSILGFMFGGATSPLSVVQQYSESKQIEEQADIEALNYVMEREERKARSVQQRVADAKERIKARMKQDTEGTETGGEEIVTEEEAINETPAEVEETTTEETTQTQEDTQVEQQMVDEITRNTDNTTIETTTDEGGKYQRTDTTSEDLVAISKDLDEIKNDVKNIDNNTFFDRIMSSINKGGNRNFAVYNNNGQKSVLRVVKRGGAKGGNQTVTIQIMKPSKQNGKVTMSQWTYNPGDLTIQQRQGIVEGIQNWGNTGEFSIGNPRYQGGVKYEEDGYIPGVAMKGEKSISGQEGVNVRNKINQKTIRELAEKYGIKVEVIEGMIKVIENGKWDGKSFAYGKYVDNLLALSEQIKESTAPHELLHAIFDMIDPETKTYLISQVMKSEGWSAQKAEEWLADSFSNFFRTGKIEHAPKSTWGKIKIFFKKVRAFINGLWKWRTQLEDIFTNIITAEGIEDLQSKINRDKSLAKAKERMRERFKQYVKNAEKIESENEAKYQKSEEDGILALQKIANGAEYVRNAMNREDLRDYGGETGISFYRGNPGSVEKDYKGGYGISHIAEKHGAETLLKMIEVIARGKIERYTKGNKTVAIGYDGYTAILSLSKDNNKETRLLTGWKDNEKKTDGSSEVSAQSTPTQTSPTFSRTDLGAVLSSNTITKKDKNASEDTEKYQRGYHGSQADFDRFDSSHMGEGEGHQVHGWGTYIAKDINTGKYYAEMRDHLYSYDPKKFEKLGREEKSIIDHLIKDLADNGGKLEEYIKGAIKGYEAQMERENDGYFKDDIQKKIDFLKSLDLEDFTFEGGERHLYEVEYPDPVKADTPTGSNYLEENKVLSRNELDKIIKALEKKKTQGSERAMNNLEDDIESGKEINGEDLVHTLSMSMSPRWASKFLESIGYDGIHYFGVRDGEGHVIFNEDNIEIIKHEKYQKAGDTESEAFKKRFGDSKVVDKDGNPLVVYHGTPYGGFTVFKKTNRGSIGDEGYFGRGWYFTNDKALAKDYSDEAFIDEEERTNEPGVYGNVEIKEVYLKIENPYVVNEKDVEYEMGSLEKLLGTNNPSASTEKLKDEGYDGVIYEFNSGTKEYTVFEPNQIKSATDNVGTYDPNSDDIRYQKAEDDIDPNIQSPNQMVDKWGGTSVITKFISKKQKKKALDVSKDLLVPDGKYEGQPYMWMHTNKYTNKIIPNFENTRDSRYKEFTDQGIEVTFFTNNEDMSKSYADQRAELPNTRKFKSIKEFNEYFKNRDENGNELQSEWLEGITDPNRSSRWTGGSSIQKRGDKYVFVKKYSEWMKFKTLKSLAEYFDIDIDGKSEKQIMKEVKNNISAHYVDNPDFHLYDGVKIGKENGEYVIELWSGVEKGDYKTKEEALAKGRSNSQSENKYIYKGIIQDMHNPLLIHIKNRYANWNDLETAYELLERVDKDQLNKIITAIDEAQKIYAKRDKLKVKKQKIMDGYKQQITDARMEIWEAKQAKDAEKEKEANKKENEIWDARTKFNEFASTLERWLYYGPDYLDDAERKIIKDGIKDNKEWKSLYNAYKKYAEYGDIGRRVSFNKYAKEKYGVNDATLSLLHEVGFYNEAGEDILKSKILQTNDYVFYALRKGGYDGVVFRDIIDYGGKSIEHRVGDVAVTFRSNQFKSWDNADPTDSKYISYQKTEDDINPNARNEWQLIEKKGDVYVFDSFISQKAKDKALNSVPKEWLVDGKAPALMHTNKYYAKPFYRFDNVRDSKYKKYGDDIVVSFFTDNFDMSKSYADGITRIADTKRRNISDAELKKELKRMSEENSSKGNKSLFGGLEADKETKYSVKKNKDGSVSLVSKMRFLQHYTYERFIKDYTTDTNLEKMGITYSEVFKDPNKIIDFLIENVNRTFDDKDAYVKARREDNGVLVEVYDKSIKATYPSMEELKDNVVKGNWDEEYYSYVGYGQNIKKLLVVDDYKGFYWNDLGSIKDIFKREGIDYNKEVNYFIKDIEEAMDGFTDRMKALEEYWNDAYRDDPYGEASQFIGNVQLSANNGVTYMVDELEELLNDPNMGEDLKIALDTEVYGDLRDYGKTLRDVIVELRNYINTDRNYYALKKLSAEGVKKWLDDMGAPKAVQSIMELKYRKDMLGSWRDIGDKGWRENIRGLLTTNGMGLETNDWVKYAIEKGYDAVKIEGIYDYGGRSETHTLGNIYVTLKKGQFKAWDNSDPTNSADIRYQKMDDEYAEAVENGNTTRAKAILREYAKEKGYNSSTDYQGSLAFNGSAPSSDGLTKEERVSGNEDIYSQTLGDFASDGLDGWDLERQLDPNGGLGIARSRASRGLAGGVYDLESINNLRNAVMEYKKGNKDVKIRMYRAIDSDIKEGKFRNGDWITPSKEYAKHHIDLQDWKKGRVISEDVSIEDIRWDGNDINERGFDNEKEYGYKDTPNNRKELKITYDDNGNLIPLSERFNENVEDERYQRVYHGSQADFDRFDSSHMGEGEGAQAHGWGHYVAVSKDTGKHYADMGGEPTLRFRGERIKAIPETIAEEAISSMGLYIEHFGYSFEDAKNSKIKDAMRNIAYNSERLGNKNETSEGLEYAKKQIDRYREYIRVIKDMKEEDFKLEGNKNLYEVEIPDPVKADTPTGSNYLEENGNLSESEINKFIDKLNIGKSWDDVTISDIEKLQDAENGWYKRGNEFVNLVKYSTKSMKENLDQIMNWYAGTNEMMQDKLLSQVGIRTNAQNKILAFIEKNKGKIKGGDLYDILDRYFRSDKEASKFLESLGYDGIHYFGGRDGEAYVIFNDDDLEIKNHEKYQKAEYEYDEDGNIKWLKFGDEKFDPSIFGTPTKEEQIEEDIENEKSNEYYDAWIRYNNQNYDDDKLTMSEFLDKIIEWGTDQEREYDEKMKDLADSMDDPVKLDLQLRAVKLAEEEGNVGKKFGRNVSKEVRDRQQAEVERKREKLSDDIYEWMYPGLRFEDATYADKKSAWDQEAEWEMLGREKIEEKLKYFKKDKNGNWEKKDIKIETPQEQREKIERSGNFDEVIEPKDRVIQWETPEGQKGRLDKAKDPRQFKKVMEKINSGKSKTKVELKDVTNEARALERQKAMEEAEKERKKKEQQEAMAKKKQEEYKRNVRLKAFQRLVDMQRFEKFTFLTEDEIKQRWGFTDEEWKKITEQLDLGYPPKKRNEKAVSDFNKAVDSEVKFIIEGLSRQNKMKQKEAEKNQSEIGEIDLDVLLGKDEEKGQKEVEEFERIAEEEKKKSKKEKNKRLEQAREDVTNVEIDKERENSKSEKERVDKIIKSTKTDNTVWGSIKKTASDILTPVSTRIREISPKIYRELMRYFQNKDILTNQRLKEIDPFLKAMGKIRKENPVRFMDIRVALANRNIGYANGLLQEYGVKVPTKLLDTIFDEAEDVGLNINYLGSYYPLSVKAPKSFLEELMKVGNGDIASEIEKKIQQESQKKGGPLDESEITAIINSVIAGEEKGPDVNLGNKHLKKRNTEIERTEKMLEYCDDPISTLITYIEGMTDKIERAKFLGKSRSGNVHTLADYVYNAKNGLDSEQQDELMELLKSVFNDASPNKFYQTWRDIATLTTLGSPSSTLTQIGDLSFSIYENGWREALKAVWDIFMKRKAFDLKDMGVINRGEEYTNINSQKNLLQKAIHNVFKLTFFSNFDTFGKSTFIQSTWNKRRKRALKGENGDPQLIKDIMKITDDEYTTMKIINDLRNGVFSEDVALVMYMKLGNIQPLTKAQMPKAYLDNPNGRLFYQFKTFGIKQLDYVLQETKQQTKGFKNLSTTDKFLRVAQIASMIFIMTLMGAGASELKDITMRRRSNSLILRWLFGEEVGSDQIWDKIGDSALQLFGLSRYTVMQMNSDPVDAITSLFTTFPATNLVTYPFKDIVKAFKNDGSINWRNPSSYQLIPVIGKYRYWIYGGGQDKQQEALDKEKKTATSGGSSRSKRSSRSSRSKRSTRN